MMKNIKKYLFIGTLVTLGICILMLMACLIVLWVADKNLFQYGAFYRPLVISAILCADCFFCNSALSVFNKTKVLSIISLALLNLATILALILFAFMSLKDANEIYAKILGITAITAAFFTIIISTNGKLGEHMKTIKIIYFSMMTFIDLIIIGCIINEKLNIFKAVEWFVFPFVLICIATFALLCVTSIMGRHYREEEIFEKESEDFIEPNEIDALREKVKELTIENEKLKALVEELQNKEGK